ncbi:MAG: arylesterase [Pseudomonadota bacterium]
MRLYIRGTRHRGSLSVTATIVFAITLPLLLGSHYSYATPCDGTVLLLGDSIGAGYGIAEHDSWAAGLAEHLSGAGANLVNASVSGETTAGGLRRLPELLERHKPALVIIELGGNDGLRGYPITRMKQNLEAMIKQALEIGSKVYVLGMHIPPNYGPRYGQLFHQTYADLAEKYDLALLPFLLEGIGRNKDMMQADGIHPNKGAQSLILKNVLSKLPQPLCQQRPST